MGGRLIVVALGAVSCLVLPMNASAATVAASANCSVSRTVRPGSGGGPDQRCVERRLAQLGYRVHGPDRFFDRTTMNSLQRFARDRGVTWRGVVTPLLLARLRIWGGPAFGDPCAVSRTVRPAGERGPGRRCVENRLAQLGFDVSPNAVFDRATMTALRQFASERRVAWRGVVTPLLLTRLRIWSGPTIWGHCTTASTIGAGVTLPGAKCLEMRLAQLGYDVTGPDRYFDHVGADSLRSYQAAHGLYVDGVAGSVTLSVLGIWEPPPATIVRSGDSIRGVGHREVALTFDDGPSPYTSQVLDVLRRYDVPATFFVIGVSVAANADALKRAAHEGHSVQNHTWGHSVLARLSDSAISAELSRASAAIAAATGRSPTCYRPPEGVTSDRVRAVARSVGLDDEVLWNVDPSDYRRPSSSTIAARVIAAANGGGVLPVLHDGGGNRANTVAALPTIIEALIGRGYRFVRLCD
jgi:peptidoglycan/xylan/chitin deacetylase (PgdA/CDA1 family)